MAACDRRHGDPYNRSRSPHYAASRHPCGDEAQRRSGDRLDRRVEKDLASVRSSLSSLKLDLADAVQRRPMGPRALVVECAISATLNLLESQAAQNIKSPEGMP